METNLIVVRHGETEWNAAGRIQGQLNSRLNEAGRAQADALAERLALEPLVAIYSSDLGRTLETAAPTADIQVLDIVTDTRLRERHLGAFQGMTFKEAAVAHPELYAAYKARDPSADCDGGESLLDVRARVEAVLLEIAARHVGDTVLVVTHGGVLDQIYRLATGMPLEAPRDFDIDNASLNRLVWDGERLRLTHWSDELHHPVGPAEF